ncbi:ABC-2 type transport system permease protein [Mesobacillus persicus]|uniref:ABC-2 type transport system permease protein n=1 Tax=Mesobacillus persicus TaxID=930146 RepID=A0A1H8DY35_9BACI|nr:ABC transporter permease [Mesobacillus persicus]SEN12219.1 ABC-2 type transport system permease protein [Mesobacillus persicus]
MFNAQTLWNERFGLFVKETSRYLRYIFNGHLVIVFLFLIGTAGFYYQEWIKTLDANFPAALLMSLLIAFALTYSPILTFLSEADKVFLLPLETKLEVYFKRGILLSLFLQSYVLLILLALVMPMYVKVTETSFRTFIPFLLILLVLKGFNLLIRWKVQYYIEKNTHKVDSIVRFFANAVLLYLLFDGANLIFIAILAIVLVLLFIYYQSQTKEKGLKWEYLIEQEEKRMGAFYRIANLFTDVPKLKDQVKRRKWLDGFLRGMAYGQDHTYSHIYTRTFFRSGDYFGLFLRLTVIGSLGLYFLTYGTGQIILALLFMYLTGFQLLPLWNHHQNKLWLDLYPLGEKVKEKAFTKLLSMILFIQTALFGMVILVKQDWITAALTILLGVLFTLFFVHFYSKKRRQA